MILLTIILTTLIGCNAHKNRLEFCEKHKDDLSYTINLYCR